MTYAMDEDAFYDVYEDNYSEYCPEGWDAEDEYEEEDAEWPNRGRSGNLPSLSFLIGNNLPPMTKPEVLQSWMMDDYNKYQSELKGLETERNTLQAKTEKVQKELQDAEAVPKTYSAAKWGATSARDALVKRLSKDLDDAYDLVNTQKQKINDLVKKNETLTNVLSIHKGIEKLYDTHIQNRNAYWEEIYGKQKPLTDLKQMEWEYEADVVEETDKYIWYHFAPDVNMEKCLRALAVADYTVIRTDERDIEVQKK
jgi:hypothetical protein